MKAKHHIAGQTVYLLARPTVPNKIVLNRNLVPSGVCTIYNRSGEAIWTLTLNTTDVPPTGVLWSSVDADHASDPWWDIDDRGYTFWLALSPGRLDDSSVALSLAAGQAYIAKVVLQSSGNTLLWPNLDDYGPVVLEFPFVFDPSPGA